ncbi:MAG TPA: hypothetical protein OIM45_09555 [Clostridiaceae bacterium]|nr:hypothetical protein [Clostridiaceae bacterium]
MKILSIDTSSRICSVSILEDKNLIIEKHNNDEKTHSQKLMPLLDEAFKESNLNLKDMNLLACSVGPRFFHRIKNWNFNCKGFLRCN